MKGRYDKLYRKSARHSFVAGVYDMKTKGCLTGTVTANSVLLVLDEVYTKAGTTRKRTAHCAVLLR
jgi:hypothetical protein